MSVLPPYAAVLGLLAEVDEAGGLLLAMPFTDDVVGRPGFLHGGAIAGLLDVAALLALDAALADDGAGITPVTATVEYLRGGRDRTTFASAEVMRLGRRIANVTATAWQDERAAPIATARLSFLLDRGGADGGSPAR